MRMERRIIINIYAGAFFSKLNAYFYVPRWIGARAQEADIVDY